MTQVTLPAVNARTVFEFTPSDTDAAGFLSSLVTAVVGGGAPIVSLPAPDGWYYRVARQVSDVTVEVRHVTFTGAAVTWADLVDVNPTTYPHPLPWAPADLLTRSEADGRYAPIGTTGGGDGTGGPIPAEYVTDTELAAALEAYVTAATLNSTLTNHLLKSEAATLYQTITAANTQSTADRNRANHSGVQAISTVSGLQTTLDAKADLVGGLVPTSQIPALALTATYPVGSQTAMLALTAGQVQPGDLAVRTDGAGTFVLTAADPSVLGNWTRLNAPTDVVSSVNGQTGTVVVGKGDVGLPLVDNTADVNKPVSTAQQAALNAKLNTAALGSIGSLEATAGTPPAAPPNDGLFHLWFNTNGVAP